MNRHLALLGSLLLALHTAGAAESTKPHAVAIGQVVPDFQVTDLKGKSFSWRDQQKDAQGRARPVVLTFWCSFCHSCRDIDGDLGKFSAEFRDRAFVAALDASADESPAKVAAFAQKHKLTLPILLDPAGTTPSVFGTKVTTTTLVIDAGGRLRYRGAFQLGGEAPAAAALKAVLAGQPVPHPETRQHG